MRRSSDSAVVTARRFTISPALRELVAHHPRVAAAVVEGDVDGARGLAFLLVRPGDACDADADVRRQASRGQRAPSRGRTRR